MNRPSFVLAAALALPALGMVVPQAAFGQTAGGSASETGVETAIEPPLETGAAPSTSAPLRLGLEEAIARGEAANLQALLAGAAAEQAAGLRRQALARLFPQIEVAVGRSREKINLASFGLPAPPGESSLVGPFNVFDARATLSAPLFDARASAAALASRQRLESARLSVAATRDEVAAAVADLYLAAVAARARIATAKAEVETAQAVAGEARNRHDAGRAAGIDVVRADFSLAGTEQRAIEAENAAARLDLALARAIGLPPGRPLELETLPYAPLPLPSTEDAIATAQDRRPDLAAARAEVAALLATEKAVRRQRLPRLELQAAWGPSGPTYGTAEDTYAATAALRLPLFDGGRIAGELAEAKGRTAAAEARLHDLEVEIEVDIRTAFLDADAASRRVEVARQGLTLAALQLQQARDRFAAGVSSSLEVTQAQEALSLADERSVAALESYNHAKIALARGLGVAGESAARFLRGQS